MSAARLRVCGSSGRHLLRRLLPFGFGPGGRATCTPVCFGLGLGDGLGDQLAASAFVSGKLTVGIDLALEDVENAGARSNRFSSSGLRARAKRRLVSNCSSVWNHFCP